MQQLPVESKQEVYTVSRLNNEVKFILEDAFAHVWVEGEISNFSAPHSGHWYFCLKDANAQVRCAMFRGSQRKLMFVPKDGAHVLIKARVSLYENRGEFQLIAEDMEERGEGKLRRAFELLKKKLEAAGLFALEHKKPLPTFPKQVGVVTSATGAAIRDILTVLNRRYPCLPVIIYPSLVQGETAAPAIVKAIQTANRRKECDVLIVARGGGSLEDLWPFNEEIVARAIYESEIPIISGVGHEVDFTIADFVADKRAPTPSAAAEMITPDSQEMMQSLQRNKLRLHSHIHKKLSALTQQLNWTQKHLAQQHPKRRLNDKMQRVDYCESRLVDLQKQLFMKLGSALKQLDAALNQQLPSYKINHHQSQLALYQEQLTNTIHTTINQYHTRMAQAAAKLDALSPLATLKRGYAIASNEAHQVIAKSSDTFIGDYISIQLQDSSLDCEVKAIHKP